MKKVFSFIVWAFVICFLLWVFGTMDFGHRFTIGCKVIEHNVTSDRSGIRTYATIVQTDDGYIEEVEGLSQYYIPVGSRTTVTVTRFYGDNNLKTKIFGK